MRIIKIMIISVLISTIFSSPIFALGDLQIENDFVQVTINQENSRYTIQTVEGSDFYDDSNQPILFKYRRPDTSFTTFKIDGVDYIYGNDYNYKDMDSGFTKYATIEENSIVSTWFIDGISITQTITLDDTDAYAGNVKISYLVENNSGREVEIGSRILLDTMLGANDGSPIILGKPLIGYSTETEFDTPPVYWKAEDNYIGKRVVSFGLLSGWRNMSGIGLENQNTPPDHMIVGHWEGLSKSKWDYTIDESLDFTSTNNMYESADSAVAMYWEPNKLGQGKTWIYEMYYGMGMFSTTSNDVYADMKLSAPERVYLNNTKDAYASSTYTINGLVENNFDDSISLENASVEIKYKPGSLYIPSGQSKIIELGDISIDQVENFEFILEIPELYSWTLFEYEVSLNADNLENPIVRIGNTLVPSLSGVPPKLQFTSYGDSVLYNLDEEKEIIIKGSFLTAAQNYNLIVSNANEKFIINQTNMIIENDQITIKVPKDMLKNIGLFDVKLEYTFAGEFKVHPFKVPLLITDDIAYKIRKYQMIGIAREKVNEAYIYNIVIAKTVEDFKQYLGENLMISIQADEIKESNKVYTITSGKVTINSIVTCEINSFLGMPITIKEQSVSGKKVGISIIGSGFMSIPNFYFFGGPFEINLTDGVSYTVNPKNPDEKDYKPVEIERLSTLDGLVIPDEYLMLQGLSVSLNHAKLTQDGIIFGGSVNLLNFIAGPDRVKKYSGDNKKSDDTNKDETKDDSSSKNISKPPDVDAALDIGLDKLGFVIKDSKVVFDGITAHGKFGIPKDFTKKFFSNMDLGIGAEFLIDSYKNWLIKMTGQIAIKAVEFDMVMAFKMGSGEAMHLPLPDELGIYGGFEPGVPLVPGVFNLKGFGMYISGLYDTFFNYTGGAIPLKGTAKVSMALFEVLNLKKSYLTLAMHEIEVGVEEVLITTFKILEKVKINVKYEKKDEARKVAVEASGDLNIEDIIVGGLSFVAEVDEAKDGPLGPISLCGSAKGGLQVPKDFFIFPGLKLLDIEGEVNEHQVYVRAAYCGVPISARYRWGGVVDFRLFSADGMIPVNDFYTQTILDEDGNRAGALYIGENFRLISDSRRAVCSLDDSPLLVSSNAQLHTVHVMNYDNVLIELEYLDTMPEISVTDPNGLAYDLTNDNMKSHEVDLDEDGIIDKRFVIVSLLAPTNGQWTIKASSPVFMKVVEVDNLPKLTSVEISNNGTIRCKWTGDQLEDKTIVGTLVKSQDDIGTIIFKNQVSEAGECIIEIPELTKTGDYAIRLQLVDGNIPVDSMCSNSIHIENPNQPEAIAELKAENIGNGYVSLSWTEVNDVDTYLITVRDLEGDIVYEFETYENDNVIGGILEVPIDSPESLESNTEEIEEYFSDDMEKDKTFETELLGMFPNQTYEITVMSRRLIEDQFYYSAPSIVEILMNEVDPCELNYSIQANSLPKEHDLMCYISNQAFVTLNLETDQKATIQVFVNDEIVYETYGQSDQLDVFITEGDNNVYILAVNDNKDRTLENFKLVLDTVAPVLRIDTPSKNESVTSTFTVDGHVEFNTEVFVDYEPVEYDINGYFSKEIQIGEVYTKSVSVIARDEAGNETEYVAMVVNSDVGAIQSLEIKPSDDTLELGEVVDYNAYIVDDKDDKYIIDDHLIKWFKLTDNKVILLNEEGIVTANALGREGLVASFRISPDYAFEDALLIEVVDQVRETTGLTTLGDMLIGINQKKRLSVYESFLDSTSRLLDNSLLSYHVSNDHVTVSSDGEVIGKAIGSSVITCSYYKNGITYETKLLVKVTSSDVYDPGKDDEYITGIFDEETPLSGIEFYQPYISGYPDGTFKPMNTLTRGELAVIFSKLLDLDTSVYNELDYNDLNNHWAVPYVKAATELGLFTGYEDHSFRPDKSVSQAELAQVFSNYWSYAEIDIEPATEFTLNHWAKAAINKMIASGIMVDEIKANDDVLRREVIYCVNKLIARPTLDSEPVFSDISEDPYKNDINAASQIQVKTNSIE